ncbi:hypothetical protein ACFL9S_07880 [Erwinia sp. AnSW2-5]|uniref:hypothetical protein n=1 Tax=Erwinia sp. AnSW2-5 TaxID=3367692 RepID=UPI0038585663
MIAELSAAMTAIKETAGLVKVIHNAKTDTEVKAATIELQNKLITLQAECFNLGDAIRHRDEEAAHFKAKIAKFEDFKSDSKGYVLHRTEGETLVYSKQVVVDDLEMMVHACPHCYQQKKISMLQPGIEKSVKGGYWVYFCPCCNSQFKMDKTPAANATQVRTQRFTSGGRIW